MANVVCVLTPDQQVLLLRRGKTAPTKPGHWNFPGGFQEVLDKTSAHAAARELFEESGIKTSPEHLKYAFSYKEDLVHVNVYLLRLKSKPQVRYLDAEHDAHIWTSISQLPSPGIPAMSTIQRRVVSRTKRLHSDPQPLGLVLRRSPPRARENSSNGTNWPVILGVAGAVLPLLLVPAMLKSRRPDLSLAERLTRALLPAVGLGAMGVATGYGLKISMPYIGFSLLGLGATVLILPFIPLFGPLGLVLIPPILLASTIGFVGYAAYKMTQ